LRPAAAHHGTDGDPDVYSNSFLDRHLGGYDHFVYVCHWEAYPLPGGIEGTWWARVGDAVAQWNNIPGTDLRFSRSIEPCGAGVNQPYVAVGRASAANPAHVACTSLAFGTPAQYSNCDEGSAANPCVTHVNIKIDTDTPVYSGTGTGSASQFDLWGMLTHEFGHAAWIGHLDFENDTMYAAMAMGPARMASRTDPSQVTM
jgi:hypothetical protein